MKVKYKNYVGELRKLEPVEYPSTIEDSLWGTYNGVKYSMELEVGIGETLLVDSVDFTQLEALTTNTIIV